MKFVNVSNIYIPYPIGKLVSILLMENQETILNKCIRYIQILRKLSGIFNFHCFVDSIFTICLL